MVRRIVAVGQKLRDETRQILLHHVEFLIRGAGLLRVAAVGCAQHRIGIDACRWSRHAVGVRRSALVAGAVLIERDIPRTDRA